MRSAPSVPGVEVGASWLGGSEHVLTSGVLEPLAALHGTFGPRRAELPESRAVRDAEWAGGALPEFSAGTRDVRQDDWRVALLAPGLVDRRVEITGPTDRKMVVNALNCGAKILMADFGDSSTPTSGNPVTGRLSVSEAVQAVLVGFRGVEDAAGAVNDIIAARIRPAAGEMMDALALQAAEPPSGAAIRPAPSRSWSSSCTARRSWPRRWRARASRCRSRTSRKCSTHRSKAFRSDGTSAARWTGPACRSGAAPGRPL